MLGDKLLVLEFENMRFWAELIIVAS